MKAQLQYIMMLQFQLQVKSVIQETQSQKVLLNLLSSHCRNPQQYEQGDILMK